MAFLTRRNKNKYEYYSSTFSRGPITLFVKFLFCGISAFSYKEKSGTLEVLK